MPVDPRTTYALILGGGVGKRLYPLTKDRAKPAVPFAGKYRLIDVPISNCLHSNLNHIFVLTQYSSQSLHRHIHQTYRLGHFTRGYVDILAAEQNIHALQWYQGTADAVRRNLLHLNDPGFTHVLILSGDQIYRMDYQELLATHDRTGADITLTVTPRPPEQAGGLGVMKIDEHYRIIDFVEKPSPDKMADLVVQGEDLAPLGAHISGPVVLASMGIYLFNKDVLFHALDNAMDDFGKDVIPWCVKHMRVFIHPFEGYWEDVGTIGSYFTANLAMTSWNPPFDFYNELQPVFTRPRFLPNSKLDEATLVRSIVSEGCFIRQAKIAHSVIGIRSVIRRGSELDHVIMLGQDDYGIRHHSVPHEDDLNNEYQQTVPSRGVGRNCRIACTIIDKNARIGDGVVITDHTGRPDEEGDNYFVRDGIVIIPKNAVLPSGTVIE